VCEAAAKLPDEVEAIEDVEAVEETELDAEAEEA